MTSGPILELSVGGHEPGDVPLPQHVHQPLVETIVAELTGDYGKCPSTGLSGSRTNKVMADFFTYEELGK